MFFSILICCVLTTVTNYISKFNMTNLYINVFLKISGLYENFRMKIKHTRQYFVRTNITEQVSCIKNGKCTNYTIDGFEKINNRWWDIYDLCLLHSPNKTYKCEKYKFNVMRIYPKTTLYAEYIVSNVEFMDVRIIYKENIYKINFGERNFYIVNNILFDAPFIHWCMIEFHNIQMSKTDAYECVILDNNIKSIILKNNTHIMINSDDYIVSLDIINK